MESMSNTPYLLHRVGRACAGARHARRLDDPDGLWFAVRPVPTWDVRASTSRTRTRSGAPIRISTRRREPSQGGARDARGVFKDEIVPIDIPQKKGAALRLDRDERSRGHDRGGARRPQAASRRTERHRRERARRERRRGRARGDGGRHGEGARRRADGPHRRPGDQRPRAEAGPHDSGGSVRKVARKVAGI